MRVLNILFLIGLISCGKTNENTESLIDSNTHIMYGKNGFINALSHSNESKDIQQFVNFHENGFIRFCGFYVNDKIHGTLCNFYDNGFLKSRKIMSEDTIVNEWYEYHSNGIIKSYAYHDYKGKGLYLRMYDSLGNKLEDRGRIMPRVLYDKSMKQVRFIFAYPPYCSNNVVIKNYDEQKLLQEKELNCIHDFTWQVSDENERFEVFVKLFDNYNKDTVTEKFRMKVTDLFKINPASRSLSN